MIIPLDVTVTFKIENIIIIIIPICETSRPRITLTDGAAIIIIIIIIHFYFFQGSGIEQN